MLLVWGRVFEPGRRAELGSFSVVPSIVRLAEQPGFARPDRV
jgi:hypothetical protein